MTIFQSILLGIVQGLTEFLPVSSSGHLVIVPNLLGWHIPVEDAFIYNVLVQVATLAGVFAYFWRDITEILSGFVGGLLRRQPFAHPPARLGWYLVLATIPAGVFGLFIRGTVENAFNSPVATGFFLLCTAVLLVTAERLGKRKYCLEHLAWKEAWWFGVFQALAIFPGISRSGATITGGMLANFDRRAAARFSFLMSIPVMLLAGMVETLHLLEMPNVEALLPVFLPGFLTAAVTGYLAIRWLLGYLMHHSLYIFAAYCLVLGLATLAVNLL